VEFPRGDQLAALSRGVLIRRRWLKLDIICLELGYAYLTAVRLFYTKIAGRQSTVNTVFVVDLSIL
jgi:hypothetical protein